LTIPGKIQAYLAAGKPILAMVNGEGARVIEESGSGIVSAAGDHISLVNSIQELLAASEEERLEMGKKGLEYSRREFSRELLISRLEGMLNVLILAKPVNNK
jgi:glycosyltransferase involved in cell wall biosynthesis